MAWHPQPAGAQAAARRSAPSILLCSLLELDLHGLHAPEATAALERRLDLLFQLLADPGTAAALASAAPGGSRGGTLHPGCLRVVVGRGAHSSGGEASIPRVVESWLAAAGHRYSLRGGSIDVHLRGAAALSAAHRT